MSLNKARYGIILDTYQGIKDDLLRGKTPTAKEHALIIIKKRKQLEESQGKTKESQAKQYNKNYQLVEFKVNNLVFLNLKNIKTIRTSKKLDYKFLGPFYII